MRVGRVTIIVFSMATIFSIGLTSPIAYALVLTPVEIIDSTGDGGGNTLSVPNSVATDSLGNVFVIGTISNNVFKITPGGTITEIIDSTGDGGNPLANPLGVATDSSGNVFVAGFGSNNAFTFAKNVPVGGTYIPIDQSALLLAGVQSISMWMIPVILAGAGNWCICD